MSFSKDFMWGAASSAFQIEGAYKEDDKGLSIWDTIGRDAIKHGENGDVAADNYHRYKEDIGLMKEIGIKTYRFSISWARVMPDGIGNINEKGIEFYSDFVDELLSNGIRPLVTLFHWDLPMALQEQGGWKNPQISDWFAEYVEVVIDRLSDRVDFWMTINEPQMFVGLGYFAGVFPPFEHSDTKTLVQVSHHVLMAHGKALKVIRENAKKTPMIGMAPTGNCYIPKDDSYEEIEKAKLKSLTFNSFDFTMSNTWWADPVFLGKYPKEAYEYFPEAMEYVKESDMELISQPLDFYGFNIYQGSVTYKAPGDTSYDEYQTQGSPRTNTNWNVTPSAIYWSSKFLYERYKKPIFIAENGLAGMDWVSLDGKVHDMQRIDFIHRYLLELKKAVEEGIPVIGYTCWSVMDNLEWLHGYDMRFGLIYVDYKTQKRTIKDSGYWYRSVIEHNGTNL